MNIEKSAQSSISQVLSKTGSLLMLVTAAWVATTAIIGFGPRLWWNYDVPFTIAAVILNFSTGLLMLTAFFRHMKSMDELQRQTHLEVNGDHARSYVYSHSLLWELRTRRTNRRRSSGQSLIYRCANVHRFGDRILAEANSRMKNRLKVLRAERDWTQTDLASALNVTRQTIHAIEKGKYDPSTLGIQNFCPLPSSNRTIFTPEEEF